MGKDIGKALFFCIGTAAGLLAGFSVFFIAAGQNGGHSGASSGSLLTITGIAGICTLFLFILFIFGSFLLRNRNMRLLELMAEKTDNAFLLFNMKKRRFEYISRRFCDLYGIPSQRLFADPDRIVSDIRVLSGRRELFRAILNGRYDDIIETDGLESEYKIINTRGEKKWIRSIFFPVGYPRYFFSRGKTNFCAILLSDITALKKEERTMSRRAALIDCSNRMVVIMNLDGRIRYVNNAFIDVSGYSESYLHKTVFFKLCDETIEKQFFSPIHFIKICSKEGSRLVSAIRCRNETEMPVELHFCAVRDSREQLGWHICFGLIIIII